MEVIEKTFIDIVKEVMLKENGDFSLIGKIIIIAISMIIAWILVLIFEKMFSSRILKKALMGRNETKARTIGSIFKSFIKVFIFGFTALFILDFLGFNISSLLAVAGIGGIAIAFAAQSIVSDVITGAFILLENQYNVGDIVNIAGIQGTIIDMGIRVVTVKDLSGAIHIVPNGQVKTVTNFTKGNMRVAVDLLIPHDVIYEDAKNVIEKVIEEIGEENPLYQTKPEVVGITSYDSFGYIVQVVSSSKNGDQWAASRMIREKVLEALRLNDMDDFNDSIKYVKKEV